MGTINIAGESELEKWARTAKILRKDEKKKTENLQLYINKISKCYSDNPVAQKYLERSLEQAKKGFSTQTLRLFVKIKKTVPSLYYNNK